MTRTGRALKPHKFPHSQAATNKTANTKTENNSAGPPKTISDETAAITIAVRTRVLSKWFPLRELFDLIASKSKSALTVTIGFYR